MQSTSLPSGPESPQKNKDREVPLVSEINELIEKERTLLELRLLDKNIEADEWKSKYEALKQKMCEEEDTDLKKILSLEESDDFDPKELQTASMKDIIATRVQGNLADLSGLRFTPQLFNNAVKALFGVRSTYPNLRIACVSDCDLSHDNAEAVAHLVRSTTADAIDLSSNQLDDVSFIGIVEVLKNRKNTPQYILLDKNCAGGHSTTLFCTMLHHLSENTWGLAVSLPDMVSLPAEVADRAARRKANRPLNPPTVGDNNAYKDLVKHPYSTTNFLTTLHDILVARKETMGLVTTSRKERGNYGTRNQSVGRAQRGLSALTTLALTQHALSRKSLVALDKVADMLVNSLTDLDLSFAYIGPVATSFINTILKRPDCQLIRLGLRGNVLGDKAAVQIMQTVSQTPTLTYLDLAHNVLTSVAAMKVLSLLPMPCLHCLDMCGNDVDEDTQIQIQSKIYALGTTSRILFDDYTTPSLALRRLIDQSNGIFMRPQSEKVLCRPGNKCLLQSVDMAKLRANSSSFFPPSSPPLRPVRVCIQVRAQPSDHCSDHRALHALGEVLMMKCEVVTMHRERRQVLWSEPMRSQLCLRDGFPNAQHAPWHLINIVLPAIPDIGVFRIEMVVTSHPSLVGLSFTFESRFFSITAIDIVNSPWQCVGGDYDDVDSESLVMLQQDILADAMNDGEHLVRAVRYPCSGPLGRVTFSARLVAPGMGETALGAAKAKALKYEIQFYCMTFRGIKHLFSLTYGSDTTSDDMLGAWKPKPFTVDIPNMKRDDRIIITAKVVNSAGGKVSNGKLKVQVQASNFQLWTNVRDLSDNALPSVESITHRLPFFENPNEIYSF